MTETIAQKPLDERTYITLLHASGFLNLFIPFLGLIVPIVMWNQRKKSSQLINEHGKEQINFQITFSLYSVIALVTLVVLIGFVLLPLVIIADLIFSIILIVKAHDGELYHVPLNIRWIK